MGRKELSDFHVMSQIKITKFYNTFFKCFIDFFLNDDHFM